MVRPTFNPSESESSGGLSVRKPGTREPRCERRAFGRRPQETRCHSKYSEAGIGEASKGTEILEAWTRAREILTYNPHSDANSIDCEMPGPITFKWARNEKSRNGDRKSQSAKHKSVNLLGSCRGQGHHPHIRVIRVQQSAKK